MADHEGSPFDAAPPDDASSSETIRIVLADDHAVVRSGLRLLLDNELDFEVVAEASDVEGAKRYRSQSSQSSAASAYSIASSRSGASGCSGMWARTSCSRHAGWLK
jgi:hypothetical protein